MTAAKKPWTFGGVEVARTDEEACGVEAPSGYTCTRLPGHDGGYVAHVFRETGTGRPSAMVDAWANDDGGKS